MQSIISHMGTAYYDSTRNAIVFIFKEFSTIYTYREALDLAINLAVNHRTNNWFFDKTRFASVFPTEVVTELLEFGKRCCKRLEQFKINDSCKVSILTTGNLLSSNYFERLNEKLEAGTDTNSLQLGFFKDRRQAENFLDNNGNRNVRRRSRPLPA